MSYIGDDGYAAPQLRSYDVEDTDEAEALVDQVLGAIERMLFLNVVHGDLSPCNLLVWEGQVTVIDLPQAVDPRKNRHARAFLERDVERICEWASHHGAWTGTPGASRATCGPGGSSPNSCPRSSVA